MTYSYRPSGHTICAGLLGLLSCMPGWVSRACAQDALAGNQDLAPIKGVSVQGRPRPEYDPLGVSLGALRLFPELTLGESYDDNIYATDKHRVPDEVSSVAGSVNLSSSANQPSLSASAGFTSEMYAHNSVENNLNWNGGVSAADTLGLRTGLSASAGVSRAHLSRQDPSFPADAIEQPGFDTRTGSLDVRHNLARGSLELNASLQSFEYDNALLPDGITLSQGFRNRNQLTLDLRGEYLLGPTTSTFIRVIQTAQNYRRQVAGDINRNSSTDTAGVGVAFQITNLMRAEIGGGILQLRNHDASQGRPTTVAFRANIEMYLTQLITVTATLERTTGTADIIRSSSYVSTTASAALDYELRRNVILSAGLSRGYRAYTGIGASDTTDEGSTRIRWLLNRSLTAQLAYTLSRRSSPLQAYLGQNYAERVVEANLELAL